MQMVLLKSGFRIFRRAEARGLNPSITMRSLLRAKAVKSFREDIYEIIRIGYTN